MTRIPFDPDAIRMLAAVLTETGLSEIEIAEKDSRIRVVRAVGPAIAPMTVAAMPLAPTAVAAPTQASAEAELAAHPGAVTSPMVGVAYLLPEPGAAPFVSVGQTVAAGQTLLLIEAMKTFNQIKAPKAGTVARVLVANGAPVEYGEVLMILEA
jgi:acetyl-CoA carboxylase biotin carboxyl carrier protein